MLRQGAVIGSLAAVLVAAACSSSATPDRGPSTSGREQSTSEQSTLGSAPVTLPSLTPARAQPRVTSASHVVIVMMENRAYSQVIGNAQAPYLNSLAGHGISLTAMHAVTHPSQPNYLALFSGSTQGVVNDSCPHRFGARNLASALTTVGLTFTGYSEGLPAPGSGVCSAGSYARKHAPWTNFTDLPASVNQPLTAFPSDFAKLPTVSFVIPNLNHDMHDGTVGQADTWLRQHLDGYRRWAAIHDSLLVVTWDEDDNTKANQIPTLIVGDGITPHHVGTRYTLYSLLRTVEDHYHLQPLGASATAKAIPLR